MVLALVEWDGIKNGFSERMRRLALFDPLYELKRSRDEDLGGRRIDMHGLGLLTLLFFFEHKLMRNNKVGKLELATYIIGLTDKTYTLSTELAEKLAGKLIETFRPQGGERRAYPFYNWERDAEETMTFSILKDNGFDATTGRQFYTLDEDGLELIFATKEFYSEYQLSINQLMIRKQLEKGEYRSALRQINEMRINVESLRERMEKLKYEVLRNIVSESTFERYKKLLQDIQFRLSKENEEFIELERFVHETRRRLFEDDAHLDEREAYSDILEITKELEDVHNEHSKLLTQCQTLINDTLVAAQQSLYFMGVESFNFQQDILLPIVTKPLPLETMKGVLHPFFKLPYAQLWSPLTILQEQDLREEREVVSDDGFLQVGDGEEDRRNQLLLKEHFTRYMGILLKAWEDGANTLGEVVERLRETEDEDVLEMRTFYHFWLYVHQRSPIQYDEKRQEDEEAEKLFFEAFKLLGSNRLVVVELKEKVDVTRRYSIQNMAFSIGEEVSERALQ
ncbi:MAG TPA: replicative DNA helicase [Bacilli bacterium]|nr:replicative DNA helicase [Bacilli bacterium]